MNGKVFIGLLLLGVALAQDISCPDGAEIYALGMEEKDNEVAIAQHNYYRQMALDGDIDDQPQAKEMPMLSHDDNLAYGAQVAVLQCEMKHKIEGDDRFSVGQNLFISWSSNQNSTQDWPAVVKNWFDENKQYTYPTGSDKTLHYSQLVWAATKFVGCNFIAYYDNDPKVSDYPYARLYGCNYGPAGNVQGQAPYEEA